MLQELGFYALVVGQTLGDFFPDRMWRIINAAAGGLVGGLVILAFAVAIWGLRRGINHVVDSIAALFGRGVKATANRPATAAAAPAPAPARYRPSRAFLLASGAAAAVIALASAFYTIVQLSSGEKQAVIGVAEALACTEPERLQWSQQIKRSGDDAGYRSLVNRRSNYNCKLLYNGKEIYVLESKWWAGISKVRAMGTLDEVWMDTAELKPQAH